MADQQEYLGDAAETAPVVLPVYDDEGGCRTEYGPDRDVPAGAEPRSAEERQVEAISAALPGPVLFAWLTGLDLSVLPEPVVVEVAAAWRRMVAHCHAGMLAAAGELGERPGMNPYWSTLAGPPPVVAGVAGDELSMRLRDSRPACNRMVRDGRLLGGVLAATGEALATGHIDPGRVAVLTGRLAEVSHQVAQAVEDVVLPDADQCSRAQLVQRVDRALIEVDPAGAVERRERARCTRRVTHPRAQAEGMSSLWVLLPDEDALRLDGVLEHTARAARAIGDPRTLDQLRADGLRDLVVGDVPAVDGPAFEVHLDPPAPPVPGARPDGAWVTVIGQPVRPRPVQPEPTATITPVPATDPAASTTGTATATAATPGAAPAAAHAAASAAASGTPSGVFGAGGRCTTCSGRPGAQVRITIAASTLAGLDDQPADLDGHGPIDAATARAIAADGEWQRILTDDTGVTLEVGRTHYRPSAALTEHIRVRDKTCAAPGCSTSAWRADLDHTIAYHPQPGAPPDTPLGDTSAANLGPLCRRHHRLKTDGGFRLRQIAPGLFEWITPTGHRYLVRPGTGQSLDTTTQRYTEPPF
jgi:hypothetical protein